MFFIFIFIIPYFVDKINIMLCFFQQNPFVNRCSAREFFSLWTIILFSAHKDRQGISQKKNLIYLGFVSILGIGGRKLWYIPSQRTDVLGHSNTQNPFDLKWRKPPDHDKLFLSWSGGWFSHRRMRRLILFCSLTVCPSLNQQFGKERSAKFAEVRV